MSKLILAIFYGYVAMAAEYNAINLSQGFPFLTND
jgi:hypothetical protein